MARRMARHLGRRRAQAAPRFQQARSPMTLAHFHAPDAPGFKLDAAVIAAFARFTRGFWQGETAAVAWALSLGLAACLLLSSGATVALNSWNRFFFDSLAA